MVVWVELCPFKRYVEVLTPSTLECNLFFGNTAIADVNSQVKMRSYRGRVCPKSNTTGIFKGKDLDENIQGENIYRT